MMFGSAYERSSAYALNEFIGHWNGAIEMHLMNSLTDIREAEQHNAFNNFIVMTMMVHIEIDLMELPTKV